IKALKNFLTITVIYLNFKVPQIVSHYKEEIIDTIIIRRKTVGNKYISRSRVLLGNRYRTTFGRISGKRSCPQWMSKEVDGYIIFIRNRTISKRPYRIAVIRSMIGKTDFCIRYIF